MFVYNSKPGFLQHHNNSSLRSSEGDKWRRPHLSPAPHRAHYWSLGCKDPPPSFSPAPEA